MTRRGLISAGAGATLLGLGLGPIIAAAVQEERACGRQLMTPEEIAEHRAKTRSLGTQQDREAYRQEHHKRMQERAKEMGMALPEAPGPQGKGMGPGYGQSQGMGAHRGRGMRGGG